RVRPARHEAPLVAARSQVEGQDAELGRVAVLAFEFDVVHTGERTTTGTHHEGPGPGLGRLAIAIEGAKPFVVVVVATQDDIHTAIGDGTPQRIDAWLIAMTTGAESGLMPEGERAPVRMRGEVICEPGELRGGAPDARDQAVRIESVQSPAPQVEGVPQLAARADTSAEVSLIPLCAW